MAHGKSTAEHEHKKHEKKKSDKKKKENKNHGKTKDNRSAEKHKSKNKEHASKKSHKKSKRHKKTKKKDKDGENTKSTEIPRAKNYTLDLSCLTKDEEKAIKKVIKKDEIEMRAMDQRVSILRTDISELRQISATVIDGKVNSLCPRCDQHIPAWVDLLRPGHVTRCQECRYRVCKDCRYQQPNGMYLCRLCMRCRQEKQLTGEWADSQAGGVHSTDLIKLSLKDKKYFRKQKETEKREKKQELEKLQREIIPRGRKKYRSRSKRLEIKTGRNKETDHTNLKHDRNSSRHRSKSKKEKSHNSRSSRSKDATRSTKKHKRTKRNEKKANKKTKTGVAEVSAEGDDEDANDDEDDENPYKDYDFDNAGQFLGSEEYYEDFYYGPGDGDDFYWYGDEFDYYYNTNYGDVHIEDGYGDQNDDTNNQPSGVNKHISIGQGGDQFMDAVTFNHHSGNVYPPPFFANFGDRADNYFASAIDYHTGLSYQNLATGAFPLNPPPYEELVHQTSLSNDNYIPKPVDIVKPISRSRRHPRASLWKRIKKQAMAVVRRLTSYAVWRPTRRADNHKQNRNLSSPPIIDKSRLTDKKTIIMEDGNTSHLKNPDDDQMFFASPWQDINWNFQLSQGGGRGTGNRGPMGRGMRGRGGRGRMMMARGRGRGMPRGMRGRGGFRMRAPRGMRGVRGPRGRGRGPSGRGGHPGGRKPKSKKKGGKKKGKKGKGSKDSGSSKGSKSGKKKKGKKGDNMHKTIMDLQKKLGVNKGQPVTESQAAMPLVNGQPLQQLEDGTWSMSSHEQLVVYECPEKDTVSVSSQTERPARTKLAEFFCPLCRFNVEWA